ncbi:transposase [Streptomyces sp. NPDC048275]|uniref:transposase n=1 Tax=Streptomyces sp. NPDC048275 TaxID=3155629 RepID=UPI0033E26394
MASSQSDLMRLLESLRTADGVETIPINQAWPELSLTAIDLLAWMRSLLLDAQLTAAEPKKLRHRLLNAAACVNRGASRLRLRISAIWSWRHELTTAFARLADLPRPAT